MNKVVLVGVTLFLIGLLFLILLGLYHFITAPKISLEVRAGVCVLLVGLLLVVLELVRQRLKEQKTEDLGV